MIYNQIEILSDIPIYRNPHPDHESIYAAFPQICLIRNGDLACVFRGGTARYSYDGRYAMVHSSDRGITWSEPLDIIVPGEMHPPKVIVMGGMVETGSGDLLFTAGLVPGENPAIPIFSTAGLDTLQTRPYFLRSRDGGFKWERPMRIKMDACLRQGISSRPILLPDNTIMQSIEVTRIVDGGRKAVGTVAVFSKDEGKSFDEIRVVAEDDKGKWNYCDGRTTVMPGGKMMMLLWAFDDESNHKVCALFSRDEGRSWSEPMDTGIQGQVTAPVALDDYRILALSNHRQGPAGIFLHVSTDGGITWNQKESLLIHMGGSGNVNGEIITDTAPGPRSTWDGIRSFSFGTPDIISFPDGHLFACYYATIDGVTHIRGCRLRLIK